MEEVPFLPQLEKKNEHLNARRCRHQDTEEKESSNIKYWPRKGPDQLRSD